MPRLPLNCKPREKSEVEGEFASVSEAEFGAPQGRHIIARRWSPARGGL